MVLILLGDMAGTNKEILEKGFKDYYKYICDTAEKELREWCWDLLTSAIRWRESNPQAHNFTGNLLNSIVVCLYRENNPVIAYFSSSLVGEAIRPKMRQRTRRSYVFNPDYDGAFSKYRPEVQTNGGWGRDDAERFFESYTPRENNLFDIVVAYTVEYADWVNQQRGTTGIMQTWQQAKVTGMTFMQLA